MKKRQVITLSIALLGAAIAGCGNTTNSSNGLSVSGLDAGAGGVVMSKGGSVGIGGTKGSTGGSSVGIDAGHGPAGAVAGGSAGAGARDSGVAGAPGLLDGGTPDVSIAGGSGGRAPDAAVTEAGMPTGTGGVRTTGGAAASGRGGAAGSVGTPNVTLDVATQYQTIEGFGFFGAQDNWWGSAGSMWSDDWGNFVIKDLGLTMWRSEYYSEEPKQDANWAKQKPVVQGFKRVADANRVPLKFILTVWSPPSSMKCTTASVQAGQSPCTPNSDGLKNGGSLDPSKYSAFADWLCQGIQNYADAGVDLYAISPQNEPKFVETYNSCEYDVNPTKLNSYSRMIKAVAPLVKQVHPNVKIFGTENMLGLEGQQWFYSGSMDAAAWPSFDVLAYHGYQDGVAPTAGSQLATYWAYVRDNWAIPHNKNSWMTETSGYTDAWDDAKGAKALGFAIYAALSYGRVSAWVWWQGSELGGPPNEYGLMGGIANLSKRYFVSKSFYRYIRPGAKMVKVSTTDPNLFVVAFVHPTMSATTIVAINNASQDKPLILGGAGIPATYDAYRTSTSENCVSVGSVSNGSITLKANSITTLVNGQFIE